MGALEEGRERFYGETREEYQRVAAAGASSFRDAMS